MSWSRFDDIAPLSFDEKVIALSITFTFVFYALGALYLVAPVVGWSLLACFAVRWLFALEESQQTVSWLVSLWLIGALLLQVVLVIGHVDYDLGIGKIIKSTVGWAKGWALLVVFIILGACLKLRLAVICRAACVIGLCALLITPLLVFAYLVNLPSHLYVSPLKILGGSGPEFFTVILYEIDPGNGVPRWRFFAPWAPAVGFVANIYFLCAWFEKNSKWRLVGLLGNALMIVLAVTRMGLLVMLIVPTAVWFMSRTKEIWVLALLAIAILILGFMAEPILHTLMSAIDAIKEARADSTRVRGLLGTIALHRWQTEAFWFGHGVVERGTHLVEFMPIGSHHNWYGLLFVKGLVGLLAFAVPFLLTLLVLFAKAQTHTSARLALGMMLILSFFSLSENLEALAYMTWPAWLIIGLSLRSTVTVQKQPNAGGNHATILFNRYSTL